MPIRNKTRARYESQTAEAQARRNDKSTYEFETCEFCGGTIVIWNGKRGACAMCQLKRDKEAAEPAAEEKKAMQIVLDVATGTKKDEVKFGNVIFDIPAIAENIRTRSAELKARIDDRMIAARERMGERH